MNKNNDYYNYSDENYNNNTYELEEISLSKKPKQTKFKKKDFFSPKKDNDFSSPLLESNSGKVFPFP